jgi:hypothetical protein
LVEVFKICHIGKTKVDHVEIFDAKVTLAGIADKVLDIYNTNERWTVEK